MSSRPDGKQDSKFGSENKERAASYQEFEIKTRIHWMLVPAAVLICFLMSYYNDVLIFETLKRCFYAGVVFWVLAEIIDYIIKKKD